MVIFPHGTCQRVKIFGECLHTLKSLIVIFQIGISVVVLLSECSGMQRFLTVISIHGIFQTLIIFLLCSLGPTNLTLISQNGTQEKLQQCIIVSQIQKISMEAFLVETLLRLRAFYIAFLEHRFLTLISVHGTFQTCTLKICIFCSHKPTNLTLISQIGTQEKLVG